MEKVLYNRTELIDGRRQIAARFEGKRTYEGEGGGHKRKVRRSVWYCQYPKGKVRLYRKRRFRKPSRKVKLPKEPQCRAKSAWYQYNS